MGNGGQLCSQATWDPYEHVIGPIASKRIGELRKRFRIPSGRMQMTPGWGGSVDLPEGKEGPTEVSRQAGSMG